jgi:hypothetical protein
VSAKDVLKDPQLLSSVALVAVKRLLGPTVVGWEPDTIRIELKRREVEPTDELMAKIMSSITVATTNTWTTDHDVLFAFAVACCGVPASAEVLHHPTPEQLCWAMHEIHAITGHEITDDEGFDPDAIDPAIAAVLHDEGFVYAPEELAFAQDALDHMTAPAHATELKRRVIAACKVMSEWPSELLRRHLDKLGESAADIQLRRLGDCKLFVAERQLRRARQHASLSEH